MDGNVGRGWEGGIVIVYYYYFYSVLLDFFIVKGFIDEFKYKEYIYWDLVEKYFKVEYCFYYIEMDESW